MLEIKAKLFINYVYKPVSMIVEKIHEFRLGDRQGKQLQVGSGEQEKGEREAETEREEDIVTETGRQWESEEAGHRLASTRDWGSKKGWLKRGWI